MRKLVNNGKQSRKGRLFLPNKSVDFLGLDVVQALDGLLDLSLVGGDVDDEDKGVVVLDLLHGGLRGEGELDHIEGLGGLKALGHAGNTLGLAGELQSLGLEKVHLSVNSGSLAAGSLLQGTGSLAGLNLLG